MELQHSWIVTYPTRSTTEAARAGSPGLVRVRWCWEWLELLRPHKGMGVISPTDRLEKRSGIIQSLFLPLFLQEFCSAWWHAGTQTARGWEGVLGTTQPSLVWRCRGEDSQRGRQGFYRSCPACCFSACWKSLCWFFTENKTRQALMTNNRRGLSLSPPGCHPFTFAPGPIPTAIINGKSGVSLLCWTQPWKFLARHSSFRDWKPGAGDMGEKQLITPAAG